MDTNLPFWLISVIGVAWLVCSALAAMLSYRILTPLDKVTLATILVFLLSIALGPLFFLLFGIFTLLAQFDNVVFWKSKSLRDWEKKVHDIESALQGKPYRD